MPENLALYAIAGVAATEATGLTNLTEIGGAGNDPEDSMVPPGLSDAFGSMAAALSATSGAVGAGRAPVDTSGLSEIIAGQQQQIAALSAGDGNQQLWHEIGRIRENIDTRTPEVPGSGGGDGYGFTIPGGEGTDIGGLGDGFDLQDLAGTGKWGTRLAAGAEIAEETGGVVEDTGGVLITTGNTLAESTKAVLGMEYSAEGTFAEERRGTETRRINYPDVGSWYGEKDRQIRDFGESIQPSNWATRETFAGSAVRGSPVDVIDRTVRAVGGTKTVPGGTVAGAEFEGATRSSPGPIKEIEIESGRDTGITSGSGDIARGTSPAVDVRTGVDTGITSGSGDTATGVISLPPSLTDENREKPRNIGGLTR